MSNDVHKRISVPSNGLSEHRDRRTRSGCWTCRKRKKKCGSGTFPCQSCVRLGLECDTGTRLVWENDARREGMRRRGPSKATKKQFSGAPFINTTVNDKLIADTSEIYSPEASQPLQNESIIYEVPAAISQLITIQRQTFTCLNLLPSKLTGNESILLDHYIQRFSRTYPTCSEPANPFLSILLPLAMKSGVVLDALLALSGSQSWNERGWTMEETTLSLRHRALRGCRRLLTQFGPMASTRFGGKSEFLMSNTSENDVIFPLATCILILLYEKLVGDGQANWMPHLKFLARIFDHTLRIRTDTMSDLTARQSPQYVTFRFLHTLFLYNDLVQSTARGMPTLSGFYLQVGRRTAFTSDDLVSECVSSLLPSQSEETLQGGRFHYPHLIARISAGDEVITDAEVRAWDGRIDWLPSFSLTTSSGSAPHSFTGPTLAMAPLDETYDHSAIPSTDDQEQCLISQLYRTSARVYLIQATRQRCKQGTEANHTLDAAYLASQATYQISQLREGSVFENALLWPISIVSGELTNDHIAEREYILHRLQALEKRFHMKHFARMQEVLKSEWTGRDEGRIGEKARAEDVFLFG